MAKITPHWPNKDSLIHELAHALEDVKGAVIDADRGGSESLFNNKSLWGSVNDALEKYYAPYMVGLHRPTMKKPDEPKV